MPDTASSRMNPPSGASGDTIVVLMGVSGSGKTTVGERLAARMGWPFHDGDDFHPPANVARMRQGLPLTDEHRWPWLEALRDHIRRLAAEGRSAVVTCSALREAYRDYLLAGTASARLVYLKGNPELVAARLRSRTGHFFHPALLASQFDTLEEPAHAIVVNIDRPLDEVVGEILARLGLKTGPAEPEGI